MKVYSNFLGNGSKIKATEIVRKKDTVTKTLEEEIVRIDDAITATNSSFTTLVGRMNNMAGQTENPVVVLGSNLFNRINPTPNYDISSAGAYVTRNGYSISDFITVTPGKVYVTTGGYGCAVGYYSSADAFVSWASTGARGFMPLYNTPKIRVICRTAEIETFGVYELIVTNKWTATGITAGQYVQITDGTLAAAAGYNASAFIPVNQFKRYMTSNNNQLGFYNSSYAFISGFTGGSNQSSSPVDKSVGVYSPLGAAYIRLSVKNEDLATMGFDEIGLSLPAYRTSFTVRKDMLGDFSTINDAVHHAKTFHPQKVDILISSGTYIEKVDMMDNYNVNLIGENRKDTIIIDKQGTYAHSTLTLSGDQYIANLTIISNHDDNAGVVTPFGYAVHYDSVGPGTTLFENCRFESYQNAAVGIGMHQSQTLWFKNCEMFADSTLNNGGALYFHNAVESGVTAQRLIIDRCTVESMRDQSMFVDDANIRFGNSLGNDMTVTFTNNIIYSRTLGLGGVWRSPAAIGTGTLTGNVKLDPMNWGNNVTSLNQ